VITVGKHAAPDGSAVHPIVAGALARRAADGADGHEDEPPAERPGPVGWPEPPAPGGGGLGWPGREPAEADADAVTRPAAQEPAAAPAAEQRGWRRLFRLRPAA
jgi:hypothetical protein